MKPKVGIAMTGSFCTFRNVLGVLRSMGEYELVPIMSEASVTCDTRFGSSEAFVKELEDICGRSVLSTLQQVEPLGPKKVLDALAILPCTGNTLGKLANGIADSPVTFACKAHLRNGRPVILGVSTNDGLSGSGENIGKLLARRHFYFIPFGQDDPRGKPYSLVAHMDLLPSAVEMALRGEQLQPILRGYE